jgi:iron complex outermembrane receptor protein
VLVPQRFFVISMCFGAVTGVCAPQPAFAQQPPAIQTMDAVIVTARRLPGEIEAERALTPGNVSTVDGESLYQRSVTNLADVLRFVPGIWSESVSGSDEIFFSSRGSNLDATSYDKNGIKLLQDGLPITTADGNSHNRVLDPLSARYATIAHGANALTYGASTLGGAIDFTSPTARNTDPVSLFASGGSHGQINGHASAGWANDDLDLLGTLEYRDWDGYREHSQQQTRGAFANAGYDWSDSITTRLYVTALDSDAKLPGALTRAEADENPEQASPAAADANYGKKVNTRRAAVKTTWDIDQRSSLDIGLSYEKQSLYHPIVERILVDFDGAGPNPPVEVFSLLVDTDHRDTGASFRYRFEGDAHGLLFGANFGDSSVSGGNYRNLNGRRNGLTEYVTNAADSLELFAVDRWRLSSAWTLVYGAQWVSATRDVSTTDAASGEARNPNGRYSSLNPRLGIIYSLDERSEFFASLSRLYEAPTNMQLEDDLRGGAATLDAMHGEVIETGLRGEAGGEDGLAWRWDVALYYAKVSDEILSIDDPQAPGNSLSANMDGTIHAGVEALVAASLPVGRARIEPQLALTVNRFSFDGDAAYDDNDLPAAPRYALRGEVLYHRGGAYLGPTFDFVGRRYADFANTYVIDSHALLGLRGGFTAERWELFAELRNLTDERYIATVNVLDVAAANARVLYPGAPRSAYAGVRLSF